MTKTQEKELKELLKDTKYLSDLDIDYVLKNSEDLKEFLDNLEDMIKEDEIIYYGNAMKYLAENDPSLIESLRLADDMGYKTKDLNSEILATILNQQNMMNELSKFHSLTKQIGL